MTFLFIAYACIWIILGLYILSIHNRQNRLIEDLEKLREAQRSTRPERQ